MPWVAGGSILAILIVAAIVFFEPADDPTPSAPAAIAPIPVAPPASIFEAAPVAPPAADLPRQVTPVVRAEPPPAAPAAEALVESTPPTAATPASDVVLKARKSRLRRTGEFREMQQQLTAALLPRLKGQWTMESTVSETLQDGTCPASVTRAWFVTFTGAASDGQEIAGRFKSSFDAEGSDSCRSLRHLNNALGELIVEPASPKAIRLSASTTTCSGDCEPTGAFEYFVPDESYRFALSERGDKLMLDDDGRRFVLTRAKPAR